MPIICMRSKVFLTKFIHKEKDRTILSATYLVASNRIRIGQFSKDQAETYFYPSARTIMELNDEEDRQYLSDSEYVNRYMAELKENDWVIAASINAAIHDNELIVILTTDKEDRNFNILNLIQCYVADNFNYYIQKYTKKCPRIDNNIFMNNMTEDDVLLLANKKAKEKSKRTKKQLMQTYNGRIKYYGKLKKKELIKRLKKDGVYDPSMCHEELVETAAEFL